jgi:hypothetical protein
MKKFLGVQVLQTSCRILSCTRLLMPSLSLTNIANHANSPQLFRLLLPSNYGRIPAPPTRTNTSIKLWLANYFTSPRPGLTLRTPPHYPVGLCMGPRFFIDKLLSTLFGTSLELFLSACSIHRGRKLDLKDSLMQTMLEI